LAALSKLLVKACEIPIPRTKLTFLDNDFDVFYQTLDVLTCAFIVKNEIYKFN